MNTLNQGAPESQEIEALLPWHAAGTLNRRDRERVERALASDSELARRFDLVREEQHETIHLNESLGAPSSRAMEKLFAAIEARILHHVAMAQHLAFVVALWIGQSWIHEHAVIDAPACESADAILRIDCSH